MRIIYLHQYFNTGGMVGGTRSAEMASRFAAAGHDVHVVTSDRDFDRPAVRGWRVESVDGYTVHWCDVAYNNRMTYSARIRAFGRFAVRASVRAASLKADVVFATSTPLTIAVPGAFAAWWARCPMVLEVRDLWPELPIAIGALHGRAAIALARWLERWAYGRSARVVALSPGMRDGVVAAGFPAKRVVVIPNACDLDLFGRVANDRGEQIRRGCVWLQDRPLVLYAGTIGLMNGVRYLVRVAAACHAIDPRTCFVVIGDGAEAPLVRAEAEHLGVLGRNFFMLPPVAKREVVAWFAAADVVCSLFLDLPEMRANSANKFFDGLAAGRAVAINYGGWHEELLTQSGAGVSLPPGRPEQAASILAGLLGDRARITAMGASARALAVAQFDRDRLARQLLCVLEDLAV